MPEVRALLGEAGIEGADYPAIATAVTLHSRSEDLERNHPHWTLTSLLKDADALDRVRLFDLDPNYFRWPQSRDMVPFAKRLFEASERLQEGPSYFGLLLKCAAGDQMGRTRRASRET